jgi:4-aminobutyrate aminotransferase-like enzyme
VDKAEGSWIHGKDGKKYLDFCCGIGVTNLGHCHPKVNAAAIQQVNTGVHLQVNWSVTGERSSPIELRLMPWTARNARCLLLILHVPLLRLFVVCVPA